MSSPSAVVSNFGKFEEKQVHKIDIQSTSGNLRASFITFGATLQSFQMKEDKTSSSPSFTELTLGHENLEQYVNASGHLGATVGRYANRIANATFPPQILGMDQDVTPKISLPANNNNKHCLHGGPKGLSRIVWDEFEVIYFERDENEKKIPVGVKFKHISPDGDQGFPGEIHVTATYSFANKDDEEALFMDFQGFVPKQKTNSVGDVTANCATVANFCNHAYWNLGGYDKEKSVMDNHHLHIPDGKFYLALDKSSIPTGEILSTKNTVLDFVSNGGKLLKDGGVDDEGSILNPGLPAKSGYDNCIVLASPACPIGTLRPCATLTYCPSSNASSSTKKTVTTVMKVFTTLPGVQVYSGNYLPEEPVPGHSENQKYGYRSGVCLETQMFPDAPNHPSHFPSTVVKPGECWKHVTIHSFSSIQ